VSRFLGQIYSLEKPGMLLEGSTANVIRRRKIGPIRETLGLPQAAEMDKAVSIVPS